MTQPVLCVPYLSFPSLLPSARASAHFLPSIPASILFLSDCTLAFLLLPIFFTRSQSAPAWLEGGSIPASSVAGKWHYQALVSSGHTPGKCPRSLQKVPHLLLALLPSFPSSSPPLPPTKKAGSGSSLVSCLFPHFPLLPSPKPSF